MTRAPLLLALLALLPGCPGPDGGTGGSCSDDSTPSAPNVAPNPFFECGSPPDGWSAPLLGTLESSTGRSGKGAKVTAATTTAGVVAMVSSATVAAAPFAGKWCASAWVKGTGENAVVILRRERGKGNLLDESFFQPLTSDWKRISVATDTPMDSVDTALYVAVGFRAPQKGQVVEVDDVQAWRSLSGKCDER